MEVIAFIIRQIFFATRAVLKIEEYHSDVPNTEQIMSGDKYPSIFSRQMDAIVYLDPLPQSYYKQERITWSLHLPYKPYQTTCARIFLFLKTAGLFDSRALFERPIRTKISFRVTS